MRQNEILPDIKFHKGKCAIYFEGSMLVLNLTVAGIISNNTCFERVSYYELDGKLHVTAERLEPCMYNGGFSMDVSIDKLHPSRIKTRQVRKSWFSKEKVTERYAESGWQRLADNTRKTFATTCYTIIT